MQYMIAAYTDAGIRKQTNQDSISVRRALLPDIGEVVMAIVCDGMGGLQKGELASAMVVNAFGEWFDDNFRQIQAICRDGFGELKRQWTDIVGAIHARLRNYAASEGTQMGTTLTGFFAYGSRYLTINIGDSRVYERKKELRQLTQDQSLVAREIACGRITEDEGRHHPQRNILLQCIGMGEHIMPAFNEGFVQGEALYLLCSDGLVHEVSAAELCDMLDMVSLTNKEAMTGRLHEITELCKTRGETDNITAVLLKTSETRRVKAKKTLWDRVMGKVRTVPGETAEVILPQLIETAQITHTDEI